MDIVQTIRHILRYVLLKHRKRSFTRFSDSADFQLFLDESFRATFVLFCTWSCKEFMNRWIGARIGLKVEKERNLWEKGNMLMYSKVEKYILLLCEDRVKVLLGRQNCCQYHVKSVYIICGFPKTVPSSFVDVLYRKFFFCNYYGSGTGKNVTLYFCFSTDSGCPIMVRYSCDYIDLIKKFDWSFFSNNGKTHTK